MLLAETARMAAVVAAVVLQQEARARGHALPATAVQDRRAAVDQAAAQARLAIPHPSTTAPMARRGSQIRSRALRLRTAARAAAAHMRRALSVQRAAQPLATVEQTLGRVATQRPTVGLLVARAVARMEVRRRQRQARQLQGS